MALSLIIKVTFVKNEVMRALNFKMEAKKGFTNLSKLIQIYKKINLINDMQTGNLIRINLVLHYSYNLRVKNHSLSIMR